MLFLQLCFITSRDERLDAFLRTMRQMKGKRPKTGEDDSDENDSGAIVENRDGSTEREDAESPLTAKEKKKHVPKTESPLTEKKKRGRPRKIDIVLNQSEQEGDEPAVKRTPGRPRKRKLIDDSGSNQVCAPQIIMLCEMADTGGT